LVYQIEICPDSGRPHLQGYMECLGQQTMSRIEGLDCFVGRTRLAVRRGTGAQARSYAMKEDTRVDGPWEYGEMKEQGKRSDLLEMKDKIDAGMSIKNLWDDNFNSMIRYHRSIREYKRIRTPFRSERTLIYIIYGKSGVGKSQLAKQCFPDAYWKTNNKWWDDYDGQEAVIWDEFKGQYPYRDLLRILDSTPLTLETKGASCQFTSGIVIFTSNHHPSEWYSDEVTRTEWANSPLNRRIREYGEIVCMGTPPSHGFLGLHNGVFKSNSNNFHDN